MSVFSIVGLLVTSLAVVVAISVLAWNGRPRGFNRLNWAGLAVGAIIFAIVLAGRAAETIGDVLQKANTQMDSSPLPGTILMVTPDGQKYDVEAAKVPLMQEKYNMHAVAPLPADISKRVADYARAKHRAEFWPQALYFLAELLGGVAVGSIMAIFFYKPREGNNP